MSVYGAIRAAMHESGRFDSVHPAPYIVTNTPFGHSYGSGHPPVNTALYRRRLSRLLVELTC